MKSKTLQKANEAVAKATPETFGAAISTAKVKVAKHKEHTSYSSAFAIGEHAELRLDFFDKEEPFGRVEAVQFSTEGITCNVAMAISASNDDVTVREFHSATPLQNVDQRLLKYFRHTGIDNPLQNSFPVLPGTHIQVGDLVKLDFSSEIENYNPFAIPVLIWGVTYFEGRIRYHVSLDCDQYRGTSAFDTIYERYVKHSIDCVDAAFIQPIGGWEEVEVDAPVLNKLERQ